MSAVPAVLVTILIFMDQQITAVIVNRKEHKLRVSRDLSHAGGCSITLRIACISASTPFWVLLQGTGGFTLAVQSRSSPFPFKLYFWGDKASRVLN